MNLHYVLEVAKRKRSPTQPRHPGEAGIPHHASIWIPAFAGMTKLCLVGVSEA